jgi:hypothetical protein
MSIPTITTAIEHLIIDFIGSSSPVNQDFRSDCRARLIMYTWLTSVFNAPARLMDSGVSFQQFSDATTVDAAFQR